MEDDMFIKMQRACKVEVKPSKIKVDYHNLEREDMDRHQMEQKILKKISLSKCLMILAIKKYTWVNELKVHFDIFNKDIQDFKQLMTDLGYMAHKLIWEIPDEVAYFTMKAQANMIDQAQIMALTPAGEDWARKAMDYIAKESNKNQNLMFAMQYVIERTSTFKKKYKEIEELEWESSERYVIHHMGKDQILERRTTLLGKQRQEQLKIAKAELKLQFSKPEMKQHLLSKAGIDTSLLLEDHSNKNQLILTTGGALTITHSQALAILNEESPAEQLKRAIRHGPKIQYDGRFKHLSETELEQMSAGVSDEEYKREMADGYVGAVDARNDKLDVQINKQWKGMTGRGYHEDPEEEYIGKVKEEPSGILELLGIDID